MGELLANATGLAGMLALAWPAIAADRLAGRLAAIDAAARHPATDRSLKDLRELVQRQPAQSWRPLHRRLLYAGYCLLLASYLLRFAA